MRSSVTDTVGGPTAYGRATKPTVAPIPPVGVPYTVTFYERDRPGRQLRALLGDSPPTPSADSGDWEVVTLPKRSAVTVWRGRLNLLKMAIPIVIGHADGLPIGLEHTALLKAWRPNDETDEPPVIKILAKGDSVPYQRLGWVLDGMPEWGDAYGGQDSNRVMQKLTAHLLEHRADEMLQTRNAHAPKRKRTRTHTVRESETLVTIANKLSVKDGWKALGDAQHPPIRDPRHVRAGQKLTVPA